MIINALMLQLAKVKNRAGADLDTKTFVAMLEKIRMGKNFVSKIDPQALAESLKMNWKSEQALLHEAEGNLPVTERTSLATGLRGALFRERRPPDERLQEEILQAPMI